jgi:hypothetical protein
MDIDDDHITGAMSNDVGNQTIEQAESSGNCTARSTQTNTPDILRSSTAADSKYLIVAIWYRTIS